MHESKTDIVDILLVEDNDADAELLGLRLERASRIRRAETLAQAVAELQNKSEPDVVLLDLGLPDGHGLAVVHDVLRAAPSTPVVVLTGSDDDALARACLEAGAADYVCKAAAFSRELRRAIDYALARTRAQALTRQLEHADRLVALGQISAGVAHEVNNPAMLIQANLHELTRLFDKMEASPARPTETIAEARNLLRESIEGIGRIGDVVSELRTYAGRGEDERREVVDVADLCRSSARLISFQLQHRARLVFDLAPVPLVRIAPRRFGQVLVNLAINAAHAIAADDATDHEVRLQTYVEGECVVVAVHDTGVGIRDRDLERIFLPFFSTKDTNSGSGLGLSISKRIVEAHGGRIDVESKPGTGTSFRVLLPIEEAQPTAMVPPRLSPATNVRRRVLLVDDDELLGRAVSGALQRYHDVVTANCGKEALATLQDQRFDVILCDLMMPDIDGVELCSRIGESLPEYRDRIVLFTGGGTTPVAAAAESGVAYPILRKPVAIRDVVAAIESRADSTIADALVS